MRRPPQRATLLAATAAVAAAALCATALARAVTVQPLPAEPVARTPVVSDTERVPGGSPGPSADDVSGTEHPEPLTLEALMLAVENDPFQPDRRRPAQRYRLPGERIVAEPDAPELPPPPPFRVLGTAASGASALAVLQVEDASPRVLGLGESLMGYTLARVEGDTATMVGQGRSLALTVAPADMHPPVERIVRERDESGTARDAFRRQQNVLEMLQRAMQHRGEGGPQIEIENGRVRVITRPDSILTPRRRPDGERSPR